jgi:hypothetical protein
VDYRAISDALTTRPFRPFRLRLNDGRFFDTYHPDWLIIGFRGRYIIHHDILDNEKMTTLEPLLIASLEHIPPLTQPPAPVPPVPPTADGNGPAGG